ncbi:glycosyltransferase [Ectothiorhodospiraceae bacterium BW-2]|nr:glycosyltransferase [Ectothiorhodospiraceae bacterium BW-2]
MLNFLVFDYMELPLISVIVPVYNVESYLPACLDSIVCQTYFNIEVLLIDDGSTDNSSLICDEYSGRYSFVRAFHKKNEGVSIARNFGIEQARGEYIGFVDGDDYIEKNMYTSLLEPMKNDNDIDVSVCGFYINKENGCRQFDNEIIMDAETGLIELFELNGFQGFVFNKLFRSSLIKENNILFSDDIYICEDQLFCYKYFSCSKKIIYLNRFYYNYRLRHNSALSSLFNLRHMSVIPAFNYMLQHSKYSIKIKNKASTQYLVLLLHLFRKISASNGNKFSKEKECVFNEIRSNFEWGFFISNTPFKFKIALVVFFLIPYFFRYF